MVIIAMFSDDFLMEKLVLKGASAMDFIYGISQRSSMDVDFSMENRFSPDDLATVPEKIETALNKIFGEKGFVVFDFKFSEVSSDRKMPFWGGYKVEFKIIEKEKSDKLSGNRHKMRVQAKPIGKNKSTNCQVEISQYEFCTHKRRGKMENYTIFLYSPDMIVIEKLRAICQQMTEYVHRSDRTKSARSKDFFDIYYLIENFKVKLETAENQELMKDIFAAKQAPLQLLGNLEKYREFHRQDFFSLKDTVDQTVKVNEFDFYFDYVLGKVCELKTLGII